MPNSSELKSDNDDVQVIDYSEADNTTNDNVKEDNNNVNDDDTKNTDNVNDDDTSDNFNYDSYTNANEILKPVTPIEVHDYITSDPVSKDFNAFVTSTAKLCDSIFEHVVHKKLRNLHQEYREHLRKEIEARNDNLLARLMKAMGEFSKFDKDLANQRSRIANSEEEIRSMNNRLTTLEDNDQEGTEKTANDAKIAAALAQEEVKKLKACWAIRDQIDTYYVQLQQNADETVLNDIYSKVIDLSKKIFDPQSINTLVEITNHTVAIKKIKLAIENFISH